MEDKLLHSSLNQEDYESLKRYIETDQKKDILAFLVIDLEKSGEYYNLFGKEQLEKAYNSIEELISKEGDFTSIRCQRTYINLDNEKTKKIDEKIFVLVSKEEDLIEKKIRLYNSIKNTDVPLHPETDPSKIYDQNNKFNYKNICVEITKKSIDERLI